MGLPSIPLKVLDVASSDKYAVVIEQINTGSIFDATAGKFVPAASSTNPYLALSVGLAGTYGARIARLDQPIDPSKGWSDGRYIATYFDVTLAVPRPLGEDVIDVVAGAWQPMTPTSIAVRLLVAQAGPSTVRDQLARIS